MLWQPCLGNLQSKHPASLRAAEARVSRMKREVGSPREVPYLDFCLGIPTRFDNSTDEVSWPLGDPIWFGYRQWQFPGLADKKNSSSQKSTTSWLLHFSNEPTMLLFFMCSWAWGGVESLG